MRTSPVIKFANWLNDKHKITINKSILEEYFKPIVSKRNPYLKNDPYSQRIIKIVSHFYNVPYEEIIGPSQKKIYSIPRQISMYFIDLYCWISYETIGKLFNNRNHSTVTTSINNVKGFIGTDRKYADNIRLLDDLIK
jgi:chromosomal replication initiator protein